MGLKIGGLTDYVKLGGAYETFTNNGEISVDKGFLEMISKSDDKDVSSETGTIGTFKTPVNFEVDENSPDIAKKINDEVKRLSRYVGILNPIVADGSGTGGISGKTGKDKFRPYIMSERPAEYDLKTGKWKYSDTKKRPGIIA